MSTLMEERGYGKIRKGINGYLKKMGRKNYDKKKTTNIQNQNSVYQYTRARLKILRLVYVKLRTSSRWVGNRTGAGVTLQVW